jgi:gamma-glutamylputrescine oxidase
MWGGGRHLDFQTEETDNFGLTNIVQSSLEKLLKENILFGRKFKIEQRWSGIMGLGAEKKPIIKPVSRNVVVAVRMGGMGVAIGSLVGELAVKEIMR